MGWTLLRDAAAGLLESLTMPLAETVALAETFDAIRNEIGLSFGE